MAELQLGSQEFKALSSDVRVGILKMLKDRNYTLTELSEKLEMAAPSTKQHLEILVGNGLIEQRDEGRKWKYYSLTRKGKYLLLGDKHDTVVLVVLSLSTIAMLFFFYSAFMSFGYVSMAALPEDGGSFEPPKIMGADRETVTGENADASGERSEETLGANGGSLPQTKEYSSVFERPQTAYLAAALVAAVIVIFCAFMLYRRKTVIK